MTTMRRPHVRFEVNEASQVGAARRTAAQWAIEAGFDDVTGGRVALVVTELGTNLVRHARQGHLLIGLIVGPDGRQAIEVLAVDHGPGVTDWSRCLADGYSTGGTSGTGLGAVRRLACTFDAYSLVSSGTVILARVSKGPAPVPRPADNGFEFGAIALAAPGEVECGDGWAFHAQDGHAAVAVIDGLGHGPDAAQAAAAGCEVFEAQPMRPLSQLLERMHESMRRTRGGAAFLAHLDVHANDIVSCGAGNISGRLVSGSEDRSLMSQHGTVGVQIRRPSEVRLPWPAHALLVLHSDGLTTRWRLDSAPGLLQHHPSLIAAWLLRDHTRGRDDVTVVVIKRL